MTNEFKLNPLNGWGADADTLYHTNMVECHRAFMISRYGKAPGQAVKSFTMSTYAITMASSGVICLMQSRGENTSATGMHGGYCCAFRDILLKSNLHTMRQIVPV